MYILYTVYLASVDLFSKLLMSKVLKASRAYHGGPSKIDQVEVQRRHGKLGFVAPLPAALARGWNCHLPGETLCLPKF